MAKHLRAQPAAGGNAEAVRLALPTTIQEAATHQKRPAFGRAGGAPDGRAEPVDERANRRGRGPAASTGDPDAESQQELFSLLGRYA